MQAFNFNNRIVSEVERLFWRYYFFSPENIIVRLIKRLGRVDNICDIGCGDGELFRRIKLILNYPRQSLGIDIFFPVLFELKKKNRFNWIINGSLLSLPLKEKAFDVVIASHVIEHVEKTNSIEKLEYPCKKLLIIYTPRGFTKFSPNEDKEENIYQRHRSGWEVEDFRRSGFSVYGIGSRLICNSLYKKGKLPPFLRRFFSFASMFSTAVTFYFPRFADHLLCIKIKENEKK